MRQDVKHPWLFPFIVSLSLYLFLAAHSIQKPMAGDELYSFEEARAYAGGTYRHIDILGQDLTFAHVPLYPLLGALLIHFFGENLPLLRSIGVVTLCGSIFFLSFFPFRIIPDQRWAKRASWIGPLLLATHPTSVQGSVILDYDATLFLLFLSFFCFFWLTLPLSWNSFWLLSSFYGLSIWARSGSALMLPAAFVAWFFLGRAQREVMRHLFFVLLGGFFLFCISWILYVHFFWGLENLFVPFGYIFDRVKTANSLSRTLEGRLQDFIRFLIWFGIPWLILFTGCLFKPIPKSLLRYDGRLNFLKCVVIFGIPVYHVVGGSSWGYPKYLNPFIPIATFLFVTLLSESWPSFTETGLKRLFLLSGSIFLLSFLFIGDPLYQLCYVLKKSLIFGSTFSQELPRLFRIFGSPFFFLFAGLFLTRRWFRKMGMGYFVLGTFLALFSTQIPMATVQALSPYPTTALYGETQRNEVIEVLKKKVLPEEYILASELVIPYEAGNRVKFLGAFPWKDESSFLKVLREKSPKAVIYSISTLSIHSYRNVIHNPAVQNELYHSYILMTFGDYSLWMRK